MPVKDRRIQKGKRRTKDSQRDSPGDSAGKKLEERPTEPPTETDTKPPSPSFGQDIDWVANWTEARTLQEGTTDPQDPRCRLPRVGEPAALAAIGNGGLTLSGGSPRFYINGQYQNVEFETELYVVENTEQCYLSARSNHERRPDGFGGYPLYLDIHDQRMFFKKELTHVIGYSDRLGSVPINFKPKTWVKVRVRITNTSINRVRCEAWFNDTTTTSIVDQGQIKCGNQTNTPPFTGVGESCFFRVNASAANTSVSVKYRNAVIRKVTAT